MKPANELVAFNEQHTNNAEITAETKRERKLELVKEGQTNTQKIEIPPKTFPQRPPEVVPVAVPVTVTVPEVSQRAVPFAMFFSVTLGLAALCAMQWWGYTQLSRRLDNIGRSQQEKAVLEGLKQTVALMNQRLERLDNSLAGVTGGKAASAVTPKTKALKKKKGRPVVVVDFSHG